MEALPVGQYDDARPHLADHTSKFQAVLPCVLDPPVGNVEGPAPEDAQDASRVRGLTLAIFGGATRPHFTLGEIDDPGAVAEFGHLQQRAPTGLLDVVTVRRDRKNVQ